MAKKTLPPGTVVYVSGISTLKEAYIAVVVNLGFWTDKVSGKMLDGFIDLNKKYKANSCPLRVLGNKVLLDYERSIDDPEPNTHIVLTYTYRESNCIYPIVPTPQSPNSLSEFLKVLKMIINLTESSGYLGSVVFDLETLILYLEDGHKSTSSDSISPYRRKLLKIFEDGIPRT